MSTPSAKPFKPTARQLERKQYAIATTIHPVSPELLAGTDWKPDIHAKFVFIANEVEVYSVLSVAAPGDAAWMLSRGVRSADEALEYLREHGDINRAVKRTWIASDALRRGVPSTDFMYKMKLAIIAYPDDDSNPRIMDVLELSTISSLSEQWGHVAAEIRKGEIRLEDIKYLGVSKLKSYRRLIAVKEALSKVHEPDAVFSMEDLKYLVDRAARDSLSETHFRTAVDYIIDEGVFELKRLDSLKLLHSIAVRYRYKDHFPQRVTYELAFRTVYERKAGKSFPENELVELFDAEVPAERAAELLNDDLSVAAAIGIAVGNVGKPIAEGWL